MSANLQNAIQEQMRVLSDDEMRQVLSFVNGLRKVKKTRRAKSISAVFDALSSKIPLAEWSELPSDGAENHDHYLYGAPRKIK